MVSLLLKRENTSEGNESDGSIACLVGSRNQLHRDSAGAAACQLPYLSCAKMINGSKTSGSERDLRLRILAISILNLLKSIGPF